MSSHDPAFLWETEALRQRRVERNNPAAGPQPGWVTLRAAHDATGIPIDTLRKWGRRGTVPSAMVESDGRRQRIVRLDSVVARARNQGRPLAANDTTPGAGPTSAPPAAGTMIVPIEAWDKMLIQLGNLHEAGQQLAEARERAAKAETEAAFLRERLAELRSGPASAGSEPPSIEPGGPGEDTSKREAHVPVAVWRYARRRWRGRARR